MPLHVHRFGPDDGQPLVALHSLKGHGRRWRLFSTEQLPHRRVYAPDLRGHGRSVDQPPWTLEQYAEDVLAVMDDAGVIRAPVIGHSLGAVVAIYLARRAPERVDRLVLLDPAIGLPGDLARQRAHDELHAPEFDTPARAAADRARLWPAQARRLVDDEVDTHLVCGSDGRWRWRYSVAAAVTAHSELARPAVTPPSTTPTMLVVADASPAVDASYVKACRTALGDRLTIAHLDCGHQVYLERADEVGRLTRQFIGEPDQ